MSTIHLPKRLRRILPGRPDTETSAWLAICGTAWVAGLGFAVLVIQAVSG
ncbi:hypothetical protein [Microbacterium oxydans]